MPTPADFKENLKQQADIVRVIGDYVKLKRAGGQNFVGLCPFHAEKTPSFSVHATRQFFHCFGCGTSGDVFSFVQKIENVSFPEAMRAVAQKFGIAMPKMTFDTESEAQDARLRGALLDVHERATEFFQECLRRSDGAAAREYLRGRGLNDDIVARFRIGYAPDSGFLLRDRLARNFPDQTLRDSGLFSWKENLGPENPDSESPAAPASAIYAKFRNRIMFPIANETGRVIAFTGRRLSTDEKAGPKYFNSPETALYSKSRVLFNLDLAKEAVRKLDYAILVEGQMDCIAVYAAGFHNVIATSGTAFTDAQTKLLGRHTRNVVVNFDPDTAGAKATERTLAMLVEEEFQVKVLTLEAGFDPDLFIRRKGRDAYAAALARSQRYFDYLIERARTQFPVRSAEGKAKAVNYLLPHIQLVPNRIVRDELAAEIAQKLDIDSAVLRQELRHAVRTRSAAPVKVAADTQITDAEKLLLRALLSARQMRAGEERLSARDGAEEEFDPARQARFVLHHEKLHLGVSTEQLFATLLGASEDTDWMSLALDDSERTLIASVLMKEAEELSPERVEGAVKALRRIRLRRELERVQRELADPRQDPEARKQLAIETARLKRALMDPAMGAQGVRSES